MRTAGKQSKTIRHTKASRMVRLAESLDMQPPVMPDDGNITRVTTGTDVAPSSANEPSVLEPTWDDEDNKAFYESLPDLSIVQAFSDVAGYSVTV
ncbi:hypothetical protein GUJ93_ZPchr0002g23998 [Zizania palustris]|uniref:Uncharacterized protein n=1 Tax=Zizania palustris TaxID=103762 RepID=A0A8J5S3W2_ZIZPA|nr:hypothetical protein GUJ93_ZPchr0002g23998 [Zizania palustris]